MVFRSRSLRALSLILLSEALNTGVGVQTLAFCFVVEANGNMMTMVKTMLS